MRQIVDELLLMAQLCSQEVQLSPVNMRAIVMESCTRLREVQHQRQAILHIPEQWPAVLGSPQWLEEVWGWKRSGWFTLPRGEKEGLGGWGLAIRD